MLRSTLYIAVLLRASPAPGSRPPSPTNCTLYTYTIASILSGNPLLLCPKLGLRRHAQMLNTAPSDLYIPVFRLQVAALQRQVGTSCVHNKYFMYGCHIGVCTHQWRILGFAGAHNASRTRACFWMLVSSPPPLCDILQSTSPALNLNASVFVLRAVIQVLFAASGALENVFGTIQPPGCGAGRLQGAARVPDRPRHMLQLHVTRVYANKCNKVIGSTWGPRRGTFMSTPLETRQVCLTARS